MAVTPMDIPLGKDSDYPTTYTPSLLYSMERAESRAAMGISGDLPFVGEDVWTAFELSWLNDKGRPEVAAVRIKVPCTSPCIVESKSVKLYLNSYAQTRFTSITDVLGTLNSDFAIAFRAPVMVELLEVNHLGEAVDQFPGACLDDLDVRITSYQRDPKLLRLEDGDQRVVKETFYTNLFRSVCPVTGQPDWASVMVQYRGRPIVRESLLKYLVSYRCHQAFHETTVEQIYVDLQQRCRPEQLTVFGRFLRRGGIDISPFRSNVEEIAPVMRLSRQ
ncbi:MAG: NADPH-dependent 7-cyano-7-deazaguanine reductase QueF [Gammaproteobacteria bacterium]|nr:NADPH-dependent 7-cyano-7-deazaguanine reductase QueF [Gammaproteobacteria bacterium]